MVAGILEKSKRLRKAFFIVKKLPISRATEGRTQNRGMWGALLSRRGTCFRAEPEQLRT
jgi:hypothetical protein